MPPVKNYWPLLNPNTCKFCDLCRWLCPDLAITMDKHKKEIYIDLTYCKGCGICSAFCPKKAITMTFAAEEENGK